MEKIFLQMLYCFGYLGFFFSVYLVYESFWVYVGFINSLNIMNSVNYLNCTEMYMDHYLI